MATEKSIRSMAQRKRDYDQISFVAPKGGRNLIKALATKNGVNMAQLLISLVLNEAFLSEMPTREDLQSIPEVETEQEAESVIAWLVKREAERNETQ